MKKTIKNILLTGTISVLSITSYAGVVSLNITASTQVSNVPTQFNQSQFALVQPWYFGLPPAFKISASPTEDNISVPLGNNLPALELDSPQLDWFYYCDGLKFIYQDGARENATVVFSGTIDTGHPGSGVYCTCLGSACSTSETVPAKLMIR